MHVIRAPGLSRPSARAFLGCIFAIVVKDVGKATFPQVDIDIDDLSDSLVASVIVGLVLLAVLVIRFSSRNWNSIIARNLAPAGFVFSLLWLWFAIAAIFGGRAHEVNWSAIALLFFVGVIYVPPGAVIRLFMWGLRTYAVVAVILTSLGVGTHLRPADDRGLLEFVDFRVLGPFSHENVLGASMAMGILLEVIMMRRLRDASWIPLFVVFLLLSQSVGAAVACVLALGVLYVLRLRQSGRGESLGWILALLAAGTSLTGAALFSRLSSFENLTTGRVLIWRESLEGIDVNLLLGMGERALRMGQAAPVHAHNDLVQSLIMGGLPAVVLLALALILLLREVATKSKKLMEFRLPLLVFLAAMSLVEIPFFPSFSIVGLASLLVFLNPSRGARRENGGIQDVKKALE